MTPQQSETLKRIKTSFQATQVSRPFASLSSLPDRGPLPIASVPNETSWFNEVPSADTLPPRPLRLLLWNVNSVSTKLKEPEFGAYLAKGDFDIICFNETRLSALKFHDAQVFSNPLWAGLNQYWVFATGKNRGKAGVCILSKVQAKSKTMGLGDKDIDEEGRVLTAEFDRLFVVTVYSPNSRADFSRLDFRVNFDRRLAQHIERLRKSKPVLVLGDLNVAFTELDAWKMDSRLEPGYHPLERKAFNDLMAKGWVDVWRKLHDLERQYSSWRMSNFCKQRNEGFRLDYCLASPDIADRVSRAELVPTVELSDHCPLEIVVELPLEQRPI